MEKELNNKKRIKLKGDYKKKVFILKKNYIISSQISNPLVLKKEIPFDYGNKVITIKRTYKNTDNDIILSCKNIAKKFNERPILKKISFNLKRGQILGLLGPNGSGKTTLFKILAGEINPDQGEIKFNNEIINNNPIHIRAQKGISFLQQNKGLFNNLTAYENLYAVLELYIKDKNKIEQKIFNLLSYFGLQYLINIKAKHFSGGELKKIAALQRVCNQNISCLLLDEPLSALDPLSISSIKNFILELKKTGLSMIITEHNIMAIQDILDYCIIIREGNIMAEGKINDIKKNEDAIKYYLGSNFKI